MTDVCANLISSHPPFGNPRCPSLASRGIANKPILEQEQKPCSYFLFHQQPPDSYPGVAFSTAENVGCDSHHTLRSSQKQSKEGSQDVGKPLNSSVKFVIRVEKLKWCVVRKEEH